MGGAPSIVTVRAGVQFTAEAAASFLRLEARLGRWVDVNSTYRDWDTQLRMYNAWQAYVAGRGPYPGHSRAIHPSVSVHCQGNALDSDDWRTPGFIALAAEYGWIRTAAGDPTEQHHFEYQWARDSHRFDPAPAGLAAQVVEEEEDDMVFRVIESPSYKAAGQRVILNGSSADAVPAGWVQDLVTHGRVRLVSYPTDHMLVTEVELTYRLGGLDARAAADATQKLVAPIIKGS